MGSTLSAGALRLTVVLLALLHCMHFRFISVAAVTKCGQGGLRCPGGECCSAQGYCGNTAYECGPGCQSGPCTNSLPHDQQLDQEESGQSENSVAHFVTREMFDRIFPARSGFYTYDAFVASLDAFPAFGTTGTSVSQRREAAAFLAHVHHETAGLTITNEESAKNAADFCVQGHGAESFKCFAGKKYFARGPLQLTWNSNYGNAGKALGVDLLAQPQLLSEDAVLSFKSALWVWMSPASSSSKSAAASASKELSPSSHQMMAGSWAPSASDVAANRMAGFGATIDILTGSRECGHKSAAAAARTNKYLQLTKMLGVSAGPHRECTTMLPF